VTAPDISQGGLAGPAPASSPASRVRATPGVLCRSAARGLCVAERVLVGQDSPLDLGQCRLCLVSVAPGERGGELVPEPVEMLADLRTWAQLLADQDQALGISPLASMASGASRTPPNPWHGAASNEEVRRIVGEHLDRLEHQLSVALAEQYGDQTQAALTEIQQGILAHRRALSDP